MLNANTKLYGELGELARSLESAMRKVSEIGAPLASDSAPLRQATAYLLDLNIMTEEGTLEVMRLTEMIQDNHARAARELAVVVSALEAVDCQALAAHLRMTAQELTQDDKYLMDIMTALSFQVSCRATSKEARHHRRGCPVQACGTGCRVLSGTGGRCARNQGKGR